MVVATTPRKVAISGTEGVDCKIGGDPLRTWLATQTRVPTGDAIASVTVDRPLEIGSFWFNLALGAAILAFMLRSYGGPALDVLQSAPSAPLMAIFLGVVATTITCLSYRWGFILRGLSDPPSLAILTLQRSAAHSLAVLVPSGKIGRDPLRTRLATQARVPTGDAIASVTVDRRLLGARGH